MPERYVLQQKQALPLEAKIKLTKQRIKEWVDEFGANGVYVSFSGGKDSTVLLHIVRELYSDVPAVFVDTGLEYPEIRDFVKSFNNCYWLKPKITFKQVIEKYGYPFISKEVAECVHHAKKYLIKIIEEENVLTDRQTDRRIPYEYSYRKLLGIGEYQKPRKDDTRGGTTSTVNLEELANILNNMMINRKGGQNLRLAIMLGMLTKDRNHPIQANIPRKDRSMYSQEKWKFLLTAPFEISNQCCNIMKKNPAHKYYKETSRVPITAQMASESRLRTQQWIRNGCNGFNLKIPTSNPMSFWTEQDVLLYIKKYHIPICSVYGDIVDKNGNDIDLSNYEDNGLFEIDRPFLKTTGCTRTGCMFCGFGCHLEKDGEGRFELMKKTHPKQYDYIMRPKGSGGLDYKSVIDWINEHGNLNIKY